MAFISWNCRGLRTRLDDLKPIISTYQPACVALQETFLKRTMTMRVRGYNCVRRDVEGDTSPSGGVCLFTSNLYPSNVVTLHTSFRAVAVRIHIHSLVTVCCVYLPPNDVVPQVDLNQLVSQLPAPFILLGDFNGHSPLWGHDDTISRERQIEQLISDHCLCLLNNDEKTYFHVPTRTFHSLDLAISFKRAKALARKIRRQSERILDPICVFNHIVNYQSTVVEKGQSLYRDFTIPILETSTAIYSTFASVFSSDSYSPAFQATKNRLERTPINFR
ncbi:RNA-directed DNA polymerase from mobile element jockey [Trichonephila clavipes]|nr:RNA-directed DNA polymerase from mobile element jockey [Trichonephila clavipes]